VLVCDTATGRPRFAAIPALPDLTIGRSPPLSRLSPDGRSLAIFQGGSLRLVDATTGAVKAVVQPSGALYSWAGFQPFSPDSTRIVVLLAVLETNADGSRRVVEWLLDVRSTEDGRILGKVNLANRERSVAATAFSADGKRVLVLGSGLTDASTFAVQVFDAGSGEPVGPGFAVGFFTTNDIWLTPDGTRVVVTSDNRVATVYDVATGKPAYPPLAHGGPVYGIGLSDDGHLLATNCVDGFFRLWDLTTGRLAAEPTFRQERFATVAASRDAKTLAVFSAAGPVYRLQLTSGAAAPLVLPRTAGTIMVNWVSKPPARLLWLLTSEARAIDAASGRPAEGGFKYPFAVERMYRRPYGASYDPGEAAVAWAPGAPARFWTFGDKGVAKDVAVVDELENTNRQGTLVISASARRAAWRFSATGGNRAVVIWDLQTGQRVGVIQTEINVATYDLNAAPFSPDDRRIALQMSGSAAPWRIYDIAESRLLFSLQLSGRATIRAFRYNPDGTRIYTGDTWGSVQVWDAANGKLLSSTPAHRTTVTRFDFSRDGKYYASLSNDGSVQVWEASTNTPVGAPMVQTGAPARVFFSPDGTRIVTPSRAGTTRVWDVDTGLPLNDPMEHYGGNVSVVAFSPDGRFVVTQATVPAPSSAVTQNQRLWIAPPQGRGRTPAWLIELATICAGQRLTEEGQFVSAADAMGGMDDIRREIAGLPDDAPYVEWGRWFLSDSPKRSIAPGFTVTPAEAKKLREEFATIAPPVSSTPVRRAPGGGKKKGKKL
jgi:WD40 repeat protein